MRAWDSYRFAGLDRSIHLDFSSQIHTVACMHARPSNNPRRPAELVDAFALQRPAFPDAAGFPGPERAARLRGANSLGVQANCLATALGTRDRDEKFSNY